MSGKVFSAWRWMSAAVVLHVIVSILHGTAHRRAEVPLSPAAELFVLLVILIGPVAGLVLAWRLKEIGTWVVAVTMAAAFVFGLFNHFVLDTPDHVANVAPHGRVLFATTAILIAVLELLGCTLAIRAIWERRVLS